LSSNTDDSLLIFQKYLNIVLLLRWMNSLVLLVNFRPFISFLSISSWVCTVNPRRFFTKSWSCWRWCFGVMKVKVLKIRPASPFFFSQHDNSAKTKSF